MSHKNKHKEELTSKKSPKEDRSAFNCEPCNGLGLKDQNTLCPNCQGKGKVD